MFFSLTFHSNKYSKGQSGKASIILKYILLFFDETMLIRSGTLLSDSTMNLATAIPQDKLLAVQRLKERERIEATSNQAVSCITQVFHSWPRNGLAGASPLDGSFSHKMAPSAPTVRMMFSMRAHKMAP